MATTSNHTSIKNMLCDAVIHFMLAWSAAQAAGADIRVGDIVAFPGFAKRAYRGQSRVIRVLSQHIRVLFIEGDGIGEEKKMKKCQAKLVKAASPAATAAASASSSASASAAATSSPGAAGNAVATAAPVLPNDELEVPPATSSAAAVTPPLTAEQDQEAAKDIFGAFEDDADQELPDPVSEAQPGGLRRTSEGWATIVLKLLYSS